MASTTKVKKLLLDNDVCRERKPNFSDPEIRAILEGIEENRALFTHFAKDPDYFQKRKSAFLAIAKRVNDVALAEFGMKELRTVPEIKKKWLEMKSSALKFQSSKGEEGQDKGKNAFTDIVLDIIMSEQDPTSKHATSEGDSGDRENANSFQGRRESEDFYEDIMFPAPATSSMKNISQAVFPQTTPSPSQTCMKTETEDIVLYDSSSPRGATSTDDGIITEEVLWFDKRPRKQNFTNAEVNTLIREVNKHRVIILSTQLKSNVSNKEKRAMWVQILEQCHKAKGERVRTIPEIQKKWHTMKCEAQKELKKKETAKATGQPLKASVSKSPFNEAVRAILDGNFEESLLTESEKQDSESFVVSAVDTRTTLEPIHLPSLQRMQASDSVQSNSVTKQSSSRQTTQKPKPVPFSDTEILCMLNVLLKTVTHFNNRSAKERRGQAGGLRLRMWRKVAGEVNNVSDSGVTRTWRDVRNEFSALRLAAIASLELEEELGAGEGVEAPPPPPYQRLVMEILETASAGTGSRDGDEIDEDESDDDNSPQKTSKDCAFPKRNPEDAKLSSEECDCLVTQVDKFKVMLTDQVSDGDQSVERTLRHAWRLITEEVNKCQVRRFRWTAKEVKDTWVELCRDARQYQTALLMGQEDVEEPVFFNRVSTLLSEFESKHDVDALVGLESNSTTSELSGTMQCTFTKDDEDLNSDDSDVKSVDEPSSSDVPLHSAMNTGHPYVLYDSSFNQNSISEDEDESGAGKTSRGKRLRGKNFTKSEVDKLLEVYKVHRAVLNCRKQGVRIARGRLHAYQSMADIINSLPGSAHLEFFLERNLKET